MQGRLLVPLFFLLVSASLLRAEAPPLSLCIVQTKSDQATHYEPSAGTWAVEMYNQLSGKSLRGGSPLAITVLPASVQKDILPEAQRLRCAWVLEVTDLGTGDLVYSGPNVGATGDFVRYSLFFSLWNRETHKAIAQGAPRYGSTWRSPNRDPEAASAAAGVAQQVLTSLNKLHN